MGTLTYHCNRLEFDDRLLAHVQIVILHKFRRREPFLMSWTRSVAVGSGRGAMWMVPAAPLTFTYAGSRAPSIDDGWLTRLSESADGSRGLIVTNQDGSLAKEGPTAVVPAIRTSSDEAQRSPFGSPRTT